MLQQMLQEIENAARVLSETQPDALRDRSLPDVPQVRFSLGRFGSMRRLPEATQLNSGIAASGIPLVVIEILAAVVVVLRRLEAMTVRELTKTLVDAGCFGTPRNMADNPLVAYLRLNGVDVAAIDPATHSIAVNTSANGDSGRLAIPASLLQFLKEFDGGHIPDLIREPLRERYTALVDEAVTATETVAPRKVQAPLVLPQVKTDGAKSTPRTRRRRQTAVA